VAEGALDPGGTFKADSMLAKHDENYIPKEVADVPRTRTVSGVCAAANEVAKSVANAIKPILRRVSIVISVLPVA
jgi:hypothetical protein